jgi:Zn finger protein HypA/HybF involved in hydrogenase expression
LPLLEAPGAKMTMPEKLKAKTITVSCLDCGEYMTVKNKRTKYCEHCKEQRRKIFRRNHRAGETK